MAENEEMFTVELESVDREMEVDGNGVVETFEVRFNCARPNCSLEVHVTFDVKDVTTLEVVPRAMSEMGRAFAALAEQSAGWGEKEA
ncbi:hypothetical protein [Methylorubrum thiocyanatum]|uniref:hypothetical protein n=1 Tax=Methylorubrum thiocyanatum TaxID=47958 RepID=UPI003F809512